MKVYDITVPISSGVPIYEGDPPAAIESVSAIADGSDANVSRLCCGVHTGTHVDAPNHFIDGTLRVDALSLDKLIGPCRIVEVAGEMAEIGPEHLPDILPERLIFKTRNSEFWNEPERGFRIDFTSLSASAAAVLADAGVKLVGIDYLSIEKFGSEDFATHRILLEREVVILEGVDLRGVPAGEYELVCLPLKYIGGLGDGSPARTVLRTL